VSTSRLLRVSGIGDVDGLQAAGVPVDEGQVGQHGRIVRGVGGELLRERVVGGVGAERLLILRDLVLAHDDRMGRVGDAESVRLGRELMRP